MEYDYENAVYEDVMEYLSENYEKDEKPEDIDKFKEELNDDLWTNDSVTGNGSGSYWFSTYKAEEALCHNLDLLADACDEFGSDTDILKSGAEACDVTIRCYLLYWAIDKAVDEYFEVDNE